ncbi:hypothetical protein [Streptomyces antarcticus]|nr:hypothetical protein [Streptomyces sp. H34-AA3]MCY0946993.1 hypothetical protein [Streptomyces sp. H34-AA3]MCZ4088116.1 hypothetical protein [Streptomyces sp. H34-S5]
MGFTFDFTEQPAEPIELPAAGPGHPPTILARSEPLLPTRYGRTAD